jgi:hypothetical protein
MVAAYPAYGSFGWDLRRLHHSFHVMAVASLDPALQ